MDIYIWVSARGVTWTSGEGGPNGGLQQFPTDTHIHRTSDPRTITPYDVRKGWTDKIRISTVVKLAIAIVEVRL